MSKTLTALTVALALIFLLSSGFALQVSDISTSVQDNTAQIAQMRAEMNAGFSKIQIDMNRYLTRDELVGALQAHLQLSNQLLDSYRNQLVISWTLITICALGGFFGIYAFFKSKRRL